MKKKFNVELSYPELDTICMALNSFVCEIYDDLLKSGLPVTDSNIKIS